MRRIIASLVALASTCALAQTAPRADIEQAWLDPAGRGSLLTGTGETLGHLEFRVGAGLQYTYGNLRSSLGAGPLLTDRVGVQVFGALGLFDWLQLGVNVPVQVYQNGGNALGITSAGLSNPWVHAKANILGEKAPVMLAVDLGVGIPVGSAEAQGNGGFEFAPRVQLGRKFDAIQVGGEVGFLFRPTVDYTPLTTGAADKVGSVVWAAATVTGVNPTGPRGEFTVRGTFPVSGARPGLEGQLGVRLPIGPVELFASAGPGFGGEPNTPTFRSYFGIAGGNGKPAAAPRCVEGEEYEVASCPELDRDGDGVKNGSDRAPLIAEDKDNFEDEDGVPDDDNDRDSVLDAADKCRDVKGPRENAGCPDADGDNDGVSDRLDACPDKAEDKDGFEDADGCPDLDNDGDGVPDEKDRCPLVKGLARDGGCAPVDGDGDGVTDAEDNCPTEVGTKENAGCSAKRKQLVRITNGSLQILDKVYFDLGRATIQARSNELLDNVAEVLKAHPELKLIQIEGHTDNTGNADKNKALSQARADAVKTYLTNKGVEASRLRPVGFGQEKPSVPNDTPTGRDANRRVEFNIVAE